MSTCPLCQTPAQPGDTYCGGCGKPLAQDPAVAAVASPAKPPAPARSPVSNLDAATPNGGGAAIDALGDLETLGSEEPNQVYLGHRLQYQRQAETFDISAALLRATVQHTTHMLTFLFFIFPGVPVGYVVLKLFGNTIFGLYMFALVATCVFIWLSPLFRRHYFPISEWKLSLSGRGASAHQVFDHIADAVVRRNAPVQYRVLTLPDANPYLNLRLGRYDAYVTCMAFGEDLYIGWTLWSSATLAEARRSGRSFIKYLVGLPYWLWVDLRMSREGRSFDITMVHRFDLVKAMRECLHAVTREGVHAASGAVPFQGAGTIGSAIPIGPESGFAGVATKMT